MRKRSVRYPRRSAFSGRIDPFAPPYYFIFTALLNFVVPYVLLVSGVLYRQSLPFDLNWQSINIAFVCVAAYMLLWLFGYWVASLHYKSRFSVVWSERGKKVSVDLLAGIVFLFGLSVLALYWFHPYRDLIGRSSLTIGFYGRIFFIFVSGFSVAFAVCAAALLERRKDRRKYQQQKGGKYRYVFFLIGIALYVFFVLAVLGGRGRALGSFITLIVIVHYTVKRFSVGQLALCAAALLTVAIGLESGRSIKDFENIGMLLYGVTDGRTFGGLYNLAVVLDRFPPGSHGFYYGTATIFSITQDLGLPFGPSSRQILMHHIYGISDTFYGFPITKPGELYINFSYWGICLACLFGFFMRACYFYLINGKVLGQLSVPCYSVILFGSGFATVGGYLFAKLVLFSVVIVWYLLFFAAVSGGYRYQRLRV